MMLHPPQKATITAPPYDEIRGEVFAIELSEGDFPFRVWLEDGKPNEEHPYYCTSVEFDDWDPAATELEPLFTKRQKIAFVGVPLALLILALLAVATGVIPPQL